MIYSYIGLFQEKYKVTQVFYTDEIKEVLSNQYQEMGTPLLFLLHGLNTDSNKYSKPAEFQVYVSSHEHHYYVSCMGLVLIATRILNWQYFKFMSHPIVCEGLQGMI